MALTDNDLDTIIATGGYDIVGADLAKRGDGNALLSHLASRAVEMARGLRGMSTADRVVAAVPQTLNVAREYPIGFEYLAIAAGATVTVTKQPQALFRGERLVVPSDIAGDFTIRDVKVGNASQFTATGPIPARAFQENAQGVRLLLDTCQPAIDLVLEVTNNSGVAKDFRAAIIGTVIK